MSSEELVDIIAETIYNSLSDKDEPKLSFYKLSEEAKSLYRGIAHDVMCAYDDYYDNESEAIDDVDDEELEDDDPYGKTYEEGEDWWDL